MKKLKKIPKFKTEDEEAIFWNSHSSMDYIDWSKAKILVFPNLKPSSQSISIRIPKNLLNKVKIEANKIDVPYQSLMKMYIAEGVSKIDKK